MTDRKPLSRLVLARRVIAVGVATLVLGLFVGSAGPLAQAPATQPGPSSATAQGRGAGQGRGGGWEWWNDVEVQRALTLSPDKVRRIHEIFTRRSAELRPMGDEFMRAFSELDKMTRARVVDEATYQLQVVRVEALRAELNKSRTVMLYKLTRELTPDQFKKLEDLRAARFAGRGRDNQAR